MLRNYRKPMVIAAPKIGLKHSAYMSKIEEFSSSFKFSPIIVDSFGSHSLDSCRGAIFCSGQIFLEISKHLENLRKENNAVDYTLIRI